MPIVSKTLATSVAVTGPVAAVDLAALFNAFTFQVISSTDQNSQVQLQGSLDNVNWFGMGVVTGTNFLSLGEDVVQYVRANVLKLASGNVTAYLANVVG